MSRRRVPQARLNLLAATACYLLVALLYVLVINARPLAHWAQGAL